MKGYLRAFYCALLALGWTSSLHATPQDDVYVSRESGEVDRISPGGIVNVIAIGLGNATSLTVDGNGNIYVATHTGKVGQDTIHKITPGGQMSLFASGFTAATCLRFDRSNNLYVTDETQGSVSKITPLGVVSKYATVGGEAEGLAFDHGGNLFVSTLSSTLYKVTPTGTVSLFADLHRNGGTGLAIDQNDNLFMADDGSSIFKITPGGVVTSFGTGATQIIGVSFDTGGDLLAADIHDGVVREYSPSGAMSVLFGNINLVEDVAVPEPGAIALTFIGALIWNVRRDR